MTQERRNNPRSPEPEEAEAPEKAEEPEELEGDELEGSRREEEAERPENIVEERVYTVPLQGAWKVPSWRRTPKAMEIVRGFIMRHMKPETVKLTKELNERVWYKGIRNPPRRIRIRAVKDEEGVVTVYLHEGGN